MSEIGPIRVTNEPCIHRIISHNVSGRDNGFREGIRARDNKCVISGVVNTMAPYEWFGFEAAHIFPLAKETLWIQGKYRIKSEQNGFLLQSSVHQLFSQYRISVNPDVS